jgi:peptidyl-prolyl cis-trans isomerase D
MIRFLQSSTRARKIVFGIIIFIAAIAMVAYLIPGFYDTMGSGTAQGVLAKVGDQEVTMAEAQQTARQMLQQQLGPQRGNTSALMPFFIQRAVQDLIYRKAMVVEAERMGMRVTDQELAQWLQHGPLSSSLFPNGQFIGSDRYEEFTERSFNVTVPQFEQLVKSDLLLAKLRGVIQGGVTVSDDQIRQEYARRNTKVKFDYAVLTIPDITKQIHPSDAELKAFYDKNQKMFENSIPEKRKFQYIVIDTAKLKDKVQVTPADLKSYYSAHMDEFRVPEEVKVRHILVSTPPAGPDGKVDPKAVETARVKAEDIQKKIKGGANFAELAKKLSDDPGSAKEGGELGWIGRGRTVPEFEKAAFSLPPGQISDLVQSTFGFHIIQVEEKHTPHVKSLDEVKAEIEPRVAQEKAARTAEALANAVQSESRTTSMAAAAGKQGLEVLTSPLVSRSDTVPGVGAAPEFMTAVFNAREKNPPELVHLPQGSAVFQVVEIKPPATPSFEEAKSRVEEDFKRERAQQLLSQKLQELSDRAHAEHNLKKAAAEVGATLRTSELVGPDSQVPEIGSLAGQASAVFELKPGEISSPINTGRGGAVMAVVERQEPSPGDFDQQKDQLRESLLAQKRSQTLDLFIDGLRSRMEKQGQIKINKQEMDRLVPKSEAS